MFFSNAAVSKFVREHFLVAWESVRPVPVAEIDFGNGRKIKRTLNGEVATYVCAPDGRIVDIIPGLSTPEAFLQDLHDAVELAEQAHARDLNEKLILRYHGRNASAPADQYLRPERRTLKGHTDLPVLRAFDLKTMMSRPTGSLHSSETPKPVATEEAILANETELGLKERKPRVHKILAEKVYKPAEITKRVYKEVLSCDLDDPYLGLIPGVFGGGAYEK